MVKRNAAALFGVLLVVGLACPVKGEDTLNRHTVVLDAQGKLIPWVTPPDKAFDRVMRLAWDFLLHTAPVESNGLKAYYTYCCLAPDTLKWRAWPHNPAMLFGTLTDSATAYYAYSGDRTVLELAQGVLDHQLAHGTTPANWEWASVPYASSDHGATEFRGAHSFKYSERRGVGDGYGVIEPDKLGEIGVGYLKFYELTGENRYRQAAIACADALARHVRAGDEMHSPWPFRVYAEDGTVLEEYSSNVIAPVRLLDELVRLSLGDVAGYRRSREVAWSWLMKYPMQNHQWSGLFEDCYSVDKPVNYNQYSPMETARYILHHPEYDPEWRTHVPGLIKWVESTFVNVEVPKEPGVQWGANAVSEQVMDMNKMGSHTSRYASINALWYEKTGDAEAKEKAFRSFSWASYMCRESGIVNVGPIDQSIWFSDGYGDYIRHFMSGLGSVPEWAPNDESHLLRSSSVVKSVSYLPGEVNYRTFDGTGTEVLRLNFIPHKVLADGKELAHRNDLSQPGWTFDEKGRVLRVRREGAQTLKILGQASH